MTSAHAAASSILVREAHESLRQRIDPMIIKVNNGETLTREEAYQALLDLYKLSKIMLTSAAVIEDLDRQIEDLKAQNTALSAENLILHAGNEQKNSEK